MITREEAAEIVADPLCGRAWVTPYVDLARTVVALYDERAKVTAERDAARIVLQQLAPLDRVEWVWPDDFADGEKPDCLCSACGDAVLVETGCEWAQGRDVCHDCATMRSEALSAVTRERDALALELRRLRAAEAPGTDDAAVAPWTSIGSPLYWIHPSRVMLRAENEGWRFYAPGSTGWSASFPLALDAMRVAVPGSV